MTSEITKNTAAEMTADEMNQEYNAAITWARYTKFENITQRAKKLTALTRIVHAGIVHEMEQMEPDAIELESVFDELDRLNQTLTDDIAKLEREYLKATRDSIAAREKQ